MDYLRWPGSSSFSSGNTSWGLYDTDSQYVIDIDKAAAWAARRLGYPIQDVEMIDVNFYDCFEEAVSEYAAQVNQFNIRNNISLLKGSQTGSNLSGVDIVGSNVPNLIRITQDYGSEVGVGGDIEWRTGSIDVVEGTQVYDLTEFANVSASGKPIEIKKVFFEGTPAISRFFDPFAITGQGYLNLIDEFGFGGYSPSVQFVLMPLYEDLLRVQAIEMNDMIRKSAFSFELINNKLRIFPRPPQDYTLHFQYIIEEDRDNAIINRSNSGVVSDYSNVPYQAMTYSQINEVGKQWIRRYFLACCKETLGEIREKFENIPIPNGEITLNGGALKSEAQVEKEILMTQLRETLEEVSNKNQMQILSDQAEQQQIQLSKIPLKIYVK